jgi:hypothetical protein
MRIQRLIPIGAAALALLVTQTVPAQTDQPAGAVTQTVKKAAKKAKSTADKVTEAPEGTAAQPAEKHRKGAATEGGAASQTPETQTAKPTKGSAQRAAPTVSQTEIDNAKASGKVWVNTETGVYHKSGKWYGTTKQGKFMTEDEAMKAGYRASKTK